jgi:sugar lactone lactonase YvrE
MPVFDNRRCELGEGALWHPERGQLFWVDILGGALLSRAGGETLGWDWGERVSAAGWIDRDHLLVASETGLWRFAIETGARERVAPLAADAPELRSNDGRADPWGGFWIGTMGKRAEERAGSIWRLWRGELRELLPGITIPNAIAFDAARELAYFADTRLGRVWSQPLDPGTGWPAGEPRLFLDLAPEDLSPDGAVVDAEGRFWNAQWGAGRVACYDAEGRFLAEERFPASRLSCPALGGEGLATLFVTSAQEGMSKADRQDEPAAGMTFGRRVAARGIPEPAVVLG